MLFNSFSFLFIFLPVALCGYYLLARIHSAAAAAWLVGMSLVFYGWWSVPYTFLMLASMTFNYVCGRLLQRTWRSEAVPRWILIGSIAANLGMLALYKYAFASLHWLADLHVIAAPSWTAWALPLGISFFTFTQIGFLIDCKANIAKSTNPIDYALFVSFFPHLIAGPILHHREMMPQFANRKTYVFDIDNIAVGLSIFAIGLAKKVIIADRLSGNVDGLFSAPASFGAAETWLCVTFYALQLYFDFSGYSDMAIGLARMFGIRFPANFNSPYKALSIIDFWQRWHMTLTRYLNLYLYNPIALHITRKRSANGSDVSRKATRTLVGFSSMLAFPTLVTMALAGIWHGAGLQYLVFGLMHGFYLIVNHAWRVAGLGKPATNTIARSLQNAGYWLLTMMAVVLAQVMFRAASLADAGIVYGGMLGLHTPASKADTNAVVMATFAAGVIIALACPNSNQIMLEHDPVVGKHHFAPSRIWLWKPNPYSGLAVGTLLLLSVLSMARSSDFLYFQF